VEKSTIQTTSKAVAYYRHSAQDLQEYSIPIQSQKVRKFAAEHGIEIIREFKDYGVSGLSSKGRDQFLEMLQHVAEGPEEFDYVLALDMSRWGALSGSGSFTLLNRTVSTVWQEGYFY